MTAPYRTIDVRPARSWDVAKDIGLGLYDLLFAYLRRCCPTFNHFGWAVISRNDDVREVMRRGVDFKVTYAAPLNIVMGGVDLFLLGLDGKTFSRDVAAIRLVLLEEDIPDLAAKAAARCAALLAASRGSIEAIDLVRGATQDVFCSYLGVTCPDGEDLQVFAMRAIEFILADLPPDAGLKAETTRLSKVLLDHIDRLIADRRASGKVIDDVLGRCLAEQVKGDPWFTDGRIRALLVGLVSTALPQPPMAVGQILEQLLRRPAELAAAQALALAGDPRLSGYVFEALRFAPLVPLVIRKAHGDQIVAAGTPRKTTIKSGSRVVAGLRSGMKDPRRVAAPGVFDPTRLWGGYMLFGDGPHTCLAEQINRALIPALLTEILKQHHLERAPGRAGHLVMRGFFPDRLWVTF
jgi:cytochrome P450